jgi:tetratricopeptide (TPR) repeat protein
MEREKLFWALRILIALVLSIVVMRLSGFLMETLGVFSVFAIIPLLLVYGFILFLLIGLPLVNRAGDVASQLFMPGDSHFRIMPEYSVAEACVKKGKYQEAVDEYRKVIAEYPDDIYPHLRIADLALNQLNDVKLAELELLSAFAKAKGEDSTALAAGRMADLYQQTLHEPARALEVMKQLRERIPGTKQARLAEERIAVLEQILQGTASPPQTPEKIALRPSRYKMPD